VIIYGLLRRAIILATKPDLCATCSTLGPHAIVRVVSWIEIFFIPIIPVWASHQLVCGRCGATRKLRRKDVGEALKSGRLPLPPREGFRDYQRWAFEETGRSPQESELDPIDVNPSRGPWDRYLTLWLLIVPSAFVALVIVAIVKG
jgi:hypothetical protein